VLPLTPQPPAWVQALLDQSTIAPDAAGSGVQQVSAGRFSLFSTAVAGAAQMPAEELRLQVTRAYSAVADALGGGALHPLRFWNFLPAPGEAMGEGLDRYMVFNAGRYDAYAQWYGTPRAFSHSLATASAVGVSGDDYVLYCLASTSPGEPIENPRQRPSWRYSRRYGPKPPCFARAIIADIDGRPRLLIGGTASIVGEHSVHVGDVQAQTQETLSNIAALIAEAVGAPDDSATASLSRMTSVRIYIRDDADAASVLSAVEQVCRTGTAIEAAIADVCRPELLVEIEAVADL
jgi:chorismate lyase/3-hydroxybenzoate synthase